MMRKRYWMSAAVAVLLLGAAATKFLINKRLAPDETFTVTRRAYTEYQHIRGEIKANNSVVISAPFAAGDLQILSIVDSGTVLKKGDVVAQFDSTTLQRTLDQKRTEFHSAEAQIRQSQAQVRLTEQQRLTDVVAAQYELERARLEASKQEIVSPIDAEKAELIVRDKEQKLRSTELRKTTSEQSGNADVASMVMKRRKAEYDVLMAERQLAMLTLRAPAAGMLTISPNYRSRSNRSETAMPFKAGDRAWPGAAIAELPDLSSALMIARVDEVDRGKLALNQRAFVRVDALPDRELSATVSQISTLGKPDFSTWPPPKNFDVALQITDTDSRLRPGMSASARIVLETIRDGIVVPAKAVFQKNGYSIVYVIRRSKPEPRVVRVSGRSDADVLIGAGLEVGERITLSDPTATEASSQ